MNFISASIARVAYCPFGSMFGINKIIFYRMVTSQCLRFLQVTFVVAT